MGHPITEPLSSRVRFVVVVRRREREAESVFFARLKKKKPELKLKKKKSSSTTQKHTAGLSDASHAVSNGLTSLEDPLGTVAKADHIKVDAAEFRAWNASAKTCSNASLIPKPRLSFAFQGSGLLLPFYQGVVQGLQDRGVLSPAVSKTAAFGGGSGGSLTSVLTALGWPGSKQYETFVGILLAIGACKADLAAQGASDLEQKLQCTLNSIGLPIIKRKIKEDNPDAAAEISNRVTICEREFWLLFFVFWGLEKKREEEEEEEQEEEEEEEEENFLPSLSSHRRSFSNQNHKKNEKT